MEKRSELNQNKNSELDNILKYINPNGKKRLIHELFISLRNAIISGELHEGYVFPNENDLCKKLEIGRSTLREAYASLETLNLISRTKNGTYVNSASEAKNVMNFDLVATYSDSKNIMEFRQIIEVGIAYSAAKKATKKDVEKLRSLLESMKNSFGDISALTIYDFEFHSELAIISGNELLVIALEAVKESYEKFVYEAFKKNIFDQSIEDHLEIIEALSKNDSEMARSVMKKHLSHVKKISAIE